MKRSFVLLTSVLAFFLFSFTAPAKHGPAKQTERKAAFYPTYYVFGYDASGTGVPNQYNITVYFYEATQYPSGTTYAQVTCPANVEITVDNGPLAGDSFTFPSGVSSYELYSIPAVLPNPLIHYDISPNPLFIGGEAILSNIYPTSSL